MSKAAAMDCTRVFYENQASKKFMNINRGGTRSSKTHSLMQLMVMKFFTEEAKRILVIRKTLPSLKISLWPIFTKVLQSLAMRPSDLRQEKVMMNFFYGDNVLHFGGMDDVDKIKSSEWNYQWIEEANEFKFTDLKTLRLYTSAPTKKEMNQMFLSFNPIDEHHWLKEDLIDNPAYDDKLEIISTYKDNPYLPKWYINELLKLESQDRNYYRIYVLGEWGRLENLIYSNWFEMDIPPEKSKISETIYGMDFGYNVPSALLQLDISNEEENTVWEKGLIWQEELTNSDFIGEVHKAIPPENRGCPIYADSAEPQRIEEFQRSGLNVIPMKKGPGSVSDSIDFTRRWKVLIHPSSHPMLKKEKAAYSYRTDRNGKRMDEPVKFNDHFMDCEKGALFTHFEGTGTIDIKYIELYENSYN